MDMKIKYVHSSSAVFKFMEKGKLHHGIQEYHIAESHHKILFRSAVMPAGL